jgi:hypothetical protein
MPTDLKTELAKLTELDRAELMERWRTLYDREPPASISRPLLLHAVAYRMQEKTLSGLKPYTRRLLAQGAADGKAPMPATNVKTGTRLLREWHGVTYEVTVTDDGVLFKSKKYQSLSEVARIITGTKWSGPLFFGLRKKAHG